MSKKLLTAEHIHKHYRIGPATLKVLHGATLAVHAGEFLAIRGASGSGKSTLLHILGSLDSPDGGTVVYDGIDLFALGNRERERLRCMEVGFVFQFYHLLPELNVIENVLLPSMIASGVLTWPFARRKAKDIAHEVVARVGLGERVSHRPAELSGGERQRVAIARALVNRPKLLLADEPTGNLDRKTGKEILDLLSSLNEQGQTIVMVTHDAQSAGYAHRCVNLRDGKIEDDTDTNVPGRP